MLKRRVKYFIKKLKDEGVPFLTTNDHIPKTDFIIFCNIEDYVKYRKMFKKTKSILITSVE